MIAVMTWAPSRKPDDEPEQRQQQVEPARSVRRDQRADDDRDDPEQDVHGYPPPPRCADARGAPRGDHGTRPAARA